LAEGRRCQVFAVYTRKHDVTARLERILSKEGIRTAVLRANVDTSKRETWYARQIKDGVQVVICHPKLVETGLDLLDLPTILFYESGYSLHTLRQASRRSWRIGQRRPVRVKFLCYEGTMQTACLRLMGKKLLVALTMEGKFAGEAKDYRDIVATLNAGLTLAEGLAAAAAIYGKEFNGALSLKALTFFEGGDLPSLPSDARKRLLGAATSVNLKELPLVAARPGLSEREVD
jgi:hypothetical protein